MHWISKPYCEKKKESKVFTPQAELAGLMGLREEKRI